MTQRAIFALTATVALTCGLRASTVTQVSIQEMVSKSEFVFEGKVIRLQAIRPDGSKNIFTRVTFVVSDVIKEATTHPRYRSISWVERLGR